MVNLEITQQFARIGIQTQPFKFNLTIRPPDLSVKQTPAEISLHQPAATLEIDYSAFREALGFTGIVNNQRQFDQKAESDFVSGLSKRVQEGYQAAASLGKHVSVSQLVTGGNTLNNPKERQLTVVSLPPIHISVQQHSLVWQVAPGGVSVNLAQGTVQSSFQYGHVRIYLEQPSQVKIRAIGTIWDKPV
jgi:hypothetical protein